MGLAAIVLLALALRAWGLGAHSLWFDEALEFQRAAQPLAQLLAARPIDQDPPLYSLLMHAWILIGRSDAWARLPGALAGALSVALVGVWGRHVGGPALGLASAALLAVAPVAVAYAQEVNQYALVLPLAVGLALALERVLAGDAAAWPSYTALSAVSVATHYGLGLLVAAQLGPLLGRARRAPRERLALAAHVVTLGVVLLCLWDVGLGRNLGVAHLQARFGGTDVSQEVAYFLDVGWRDVLVFLTVPWSGGAALFVARASAVLAAVGAAWVWRRGGPGRRAVSAAFLAPLGLSYLASGLGWYPLGGRYALMVAPALFVGVAAAAEAVARGCRCRALGLAMLGGLAAGLVACLPQLDAENPFVAVPREELRPLLLEVATRVRAGEGEHIYVYAGAQPAFDKYAGDGLLPTSVPVLQGRAYDGRTVDEESARLQAWVGPNAPVWLVFAHVAPGDHEAMLESLLLRPGRPWQLLDSLDAENAMAYLLVGPSDTHVSTDMRHAPDWPAARGPRTPRLRIGENARPIWTNGRTGAIIARGSRWPTRRYHVNKTEMITKLAKKTGITKQQAAEAVNAIFETAPGQGIIAVALDAGDTVTLPGFGTFGTARRKAREGRNPQTGAALKIAARTVPVFRAGKGLKDRVRV